MVQNLREIVPGRAVCSLYSFGGPALSCRVIRMIRTASKQQRIRRLNKENPQVQKRLLEFTIRSNSLEALLSTQGWQRELVPGE